MLEHIPDVDRCLCECLRVLKNNGLMLHDMPSRWWKIFNTGLGIRKLKLPGIHGVSGSHLQEYYVLGKNAWRKRIESHGLSVSEIIGLPFYFGHGNSYIPAIEAGNSLKLCGSYLYVVWKPLCRDAIYTKSPHLRTLTLSR